MTLALHLGDCLDVLRTLPDASVDAVVTDPPYGLAFMGKRWDYDVPSVAIWAECLRVLKPGGHLLAFAGTRTQHRMAVRIEDAGFEIRDMIAWVYGSGFPKSLDVSKAIDKAAGVEREVVGQYVHPATGKHHGDFRTDGDRASYGSFSMCEDSRSITAPATPEAQQWSGWGTALKPALEPITMARKPLASTVAANVLEHGTGALNVDGCRVEGMAPVTVQGQSARAGEVYGADQRDQRVFEPHTSGRWPANLIHDGSDEVVGLFPQSIKGQVGMSKTQGGHRFIKGDTESVQKFDYGHSDTGSAARFFYTAKASRDDRSDGNTHPTVKPTDLMRYLCRLVTPPGGVVLDPFMGSGSTGKAAMLEGFGFIGIEREAAYHAIAERRIHQAGAAGHQPDLFTSALPS
jgi:site-specific DNA-methyltransferase (adenine-specific)